MANKNFHERSAVKKWKLWQAHVRAWRKSGLSQNEYCRRNQLSSSQFSYWKKNLRQQAKSSVSFVPVPVHAPDLQSASGGDDSGLTIFLDNGIRIRLNNDFTAATLTKVVAVFEGQS